MDVAGGTAAPLAICPLVSKNLGGTPKVAAFVGVLAVTECPVYHVLDEFPLPSELKGTTVAEETGFCCCPHPQGSPHPGNGSTPGPVAQSEEQWVEVAYARNTSQESNACFLSSKQIVDIDSKRGVKFGESCTAVMTL